MKVVKRVKDVKEGAWAEAPLSADGVTDRVSGELVRSSYYDLLGMKPMLGRVLGPQENDPANPGLALVISFALVPPALGLVVLLACYLPARRAASADPSTILRAL